MKTWMWVLLVILALGFLAALGFYFLAKKGRKNIIRLILINQEKVSSMFALTQEMLDGMTDKQLMDVWTNIQNTAQANNIQLLQ